MCIKNYELELYYNIYFIIYKNIESAAAAYYSQSIYFLDFFINIFLIKFHVFIYRSIDLIFVKIIYKKEYSIIICIKNMDKIYI